MATTTKNATCAGCPEPEGEIRPYLCRFDQDPEAEVETLYCETCAYLAERNWNGCTLSIRPKPAATPLEIKTEDEALAEEIAEVLHQSGFNADEDHEALFGSGWKLVGVRLIGDRIREQVSLLLSTGLIR